MKSLIKKLKNKNIKFLFGLILLTTLNFSVLYSINPPLVKTNGDLDDLKSSVVYYNIVIDDLPGSVIDWAWAETQPWFGGGTGTVSNPYILEGLIVDGNLTDSCISIFNSEAYFVIRECTLGNSTTGTNGGIFLNNATNGEILNNYFDNHRNAAIYGIASDHNFISDNVINNSQHGIYLDVVSSHNDIRDNEIYGDTTGTGIIIWDGDYNIMINNIVENCWQGIWVYAANSTTLMENEALNNLQNGIIVLQHSYNTNLLDNKAEKNVLNGISLSWSFDSTIERNLLNENMQSGISLDNSDDNIILNNTLRNNDLYGVYLSGGSDGNLVFQNRFLNNSENAIDNGANNNWNNSMIGNYWNDYTGYDLDMDGIGDDPYSINGSAGTLDYLPIWNIQLPIVINDLPSSSNDWAWAVTQPWCSGSGTELDPYIIEGMNIDANETDSCISIWHSEAFFIIQDCSLNNSTFGSNGGVFLTNVTNGNIIGNSFYNHRNAGVYGTATDYITVTGNTFENHQHGVYLGGSYNEVIGNTFKGDGTGSGIIIQFSSTYHDNLIDGNTVENCWQGIFIFDSDNNTISGNTLIKNLNYGIAVTATADNNLFLGNSLLNNTLSGIIIENCVDSTIEGTKAIANQQHGIYLMNADYTTIYHNRLINNVQDGVHLATGSSNNLIYYNFFGGNGRHANDDGATNNWNSTTIGNYWDNHTGPDTSPVDGIVDTPYTFITGGAGSIDYLPIAEDGPPVIVIISPLEGVTFGVIPPSFTVTVTDAFVLDMWYSLDGGVTKYFFTTNETIDQVAWDALPEGSITISFYVNDTGGNVSSDSVNVVKSLPEPPGDNFLFVIILVVSIVSGIAVVTAVLLVRRKKNRKQS
jgi:parallel beta-helix repeat protein